MTSNDKKKQSNFDNGVTHKSDKPEFNVHNKINKIIKSHQ